VEHFIELVPLRKADISTIYEALTDCMKKKGLVFGNMIGMGFDGAVTFSGRHNGVQNKRIHLTQFLCIALQLQAANNTQPIHSNRCVTGLLQ